MANSKKVQQAKYLEILIKKIEICRNYKPKFGQGKEVSLEEFQTLYGTDPFYSWFGMDDSLIYAAHKAAGGITSLYRQVGIGCEQLFRQILQDQLGLTNEQVRWAYELQADVGKVRTLSLDGRIEIEDIASKEYRTKVTDWLTQAVAKKSLDAKIASALKGAVFEVRQGYKSKDSKRQNADISNAGIAYAQGYLPVVLMLSTQIDSDVAERYAHAGWLILRGNLDESPISSTYAFCKRVLKYDLAAFLKTNSMQLKRIVEQVVESLLKA
ncbi:MAG: hypothetical protein AB1757_24850 [Acidobacteriota bacterium]